MLGNTRATSKHTKTPPWLHDLWQHWKKLYSEPFRGLTTDGRIRTDLFALQDEGVCIEPIVHAAETLLDMLTSHQLARTLFHVDAPEWRSWSNPEFLLSDKEIRLDEVNTNIQGAVLKILSLSLSARGYQKARDAMRINGFLGLLVQAPSVCNESSYNFAMFGTPNRWKPWGWSLYGHHFCLNVFLYRNQIVVSPCFTGAEPNEIDEGENSGTTILQSEQDLGLELMRALPKHMQAMAQLYELMKDPRMPPGRWNRDDQRHVCGAYRDNRVVPYEGLVVANMPVDAISLVEQILLEFLLYLPENARDMRLAQARQYYEETFFCWFVEFGPDVHSTIVFSRLLLLSSLTTIPGSSYRIPSQQDFTSTPCFGPRMAETTGKH